MNTKPAIGYACINQTLSTGKNKITTNRSMIKSTFVQRGLPYASELGLKNAKDLLPILKWNVEHGIFLFRLSSDFFPWASEYRLEDLQDYEEIKSTLAEAGEFAKQNGLRITSHPGPFVVLTSPKENVVRNAITDLEIHGKVFDLMGLEHSPYNKINIHCNGVYGDKISAMDRFCENFQRLSHSVQLRLTVENDDKATMYSVKDLMYIHNKIGIPIVFDYHHHKFNTGDLSQREALELAVSTWKDSIVPIVHYSESKSLHENNPKIKAQAHSDYINSLPDTYGLDVDIMIEAKAKELAILPFIGMRNVEHYSGLLSLENY
jgi:UV DNA damage endonuclease